MRGLLLGALALVLACGGDDDGAEDAGTLDGEVFDTPPPIDAGVDAPRLPDAGTDAGPPPSCADALEPRVFDLAPGFLDTQIHPYAVFDGELIWATVTAHVDGEEGLDVFLTTIDCNGVSRGLADGMPGRVHEDASPNDIDGTIAIQGDRVLVAWQLDEGEGVQTAARAFDRVTRTALGTETRVVTMREGLPVTGTTWFPHLAPRAAGGFWLAGSRGIEEARGFQVFLQPLDLDGALDGDAIEPLYMEDVSESLPTLAVGPDGTHLVWNHEPTDGDGAAYYAGGAADTGALDTTVVTSRDPGVAVDAAGNVFAAHTTGSTFVSLQAVGVADSLVEVTRRGVAPYLAARDTGGAILYARGMSGFSATELIVRAYSFDGTDLALGPEVNVPIGALFPVPYRPSIQHLDGDHYLVVWSEGTNPNFVAKGAFVALPAP